MTIWVITRLPRGATGVRTRKRLALFRFRFSAVFDGLGPSRGGDRLVSVTAHSLPPSGEQPFARALAPDQREIKAKCIRLYLVSEESYRRMSLLCHSPAR